VAEDVELLPSGTAGMLGRTEPYRGHAGVREYFADASRVWDDITLHAEDIRAIAGSVVVFGRVDATRDGQAVRRRVLWTWKVRDGLAYSVNVNDLGAAAPG
jgi:ketosteroid isomerase-like protein